jgi:hypothetical protein
VSVKPDLLAHAMKICGECALKELTAFEIGSRSHIDVALNAARYYKSMASDVHTFETFRDALSASISRHEE